MCCDIGSRTEISHSITTVLTELCRCRFEHRFKHRQEFECIQD